MIKRTTCNRDCPDACGILATVEDGRVVRLQGDPDHPVTRGFLCFRTNRFLDRQYDPERITTPLVREGEDFRAVEWDVALQFVAQAMLRIRDESGPAAILNYRSGGSLGVLKHGIDAFFERFGPVTIKSGDICSGAGDAAQEEDFGEEDSHDLADLANSRSIVLWGKNPYVSNVHALPVLKEAQRNGTALIQIDPVHHRGADLCDRYLQPRPGGDIALALGVAALLFERGQTDPTAARYCDHLEPFEAACRVRTPEAWADIADVTVDELDALARVYARAPVATLVGWGMQRREHGSATVRVIDALGAISGNVGVPGGGVSFYFKRRGAFDLSFSRGLEVAPRSIPESLLGQGILDASDPPIRMVWVTNGNPVAMLPDSESVRLALESRELTVVVDAFLTDTARAADVVLPTTTMLEDEDLVGAYGHHYLGNVSPVVKPPGDALTDHEMLRRLAPLVGVEGFDEDARAWKRRMLGRVAGEGASLAALERGAVRNPLAPTVLFADRKFPTPTGRINLVRDPPVDPPEVTADYPLLLMALSTARAQASQWPASEQRGPATVTVHPDAAPGMTEDDVVRLSSETASIEVRLRLDPRQRRDVALMDKGGWLRSGRCANALIAPRETDAGGGAMYYDTPVRLDRP